MPSSLPPPADFDPIARPYRWVEHAILGTLLHKTRTHFLPRLLDRRQALLFGDGDGRFLARLLAQNPHLHADAVDTSATMLHLLRRRARSVVARSTFSHAPTPSSRFRTHHRNALTCIPHRSPDLVVTHFFLDCLTQPELDRLVRQIVPTLQPEALWLVSDFRIPPGALRLPALLFVRALYLAFRLLTGLRVTRLPDHHTAMTQAGLVRIAQHHRLFGLLTTELWRMPNASPPE